MVDYIDHLVAAETEFPPGHTHHNGVPFSVVRVAEDSGFEIFIEWIVGGCCMWCSNIVRILVLSLLISGHYLTLPSGTTSVTEKSM